MLGHLRLRQALAGVTATGLSVVGLVVTTTPAYADGLSHNNIVIVTSGAGTVGHEQSSTSGAVDHNGTVDNVNEAFARSSCQDCRTVAVAVQVVVAEGAITDYQPENVAVALNDQCSSCSTLAYARQIVIQEPGAVTMDRSGWKQVEQIAQQIDQTAASSEDFTTMQADLDQLTAQLSSAVQQDLVSQGAHPSGDRGRRDVESS